MRDLDADLVQLALEKGLVAADDVARVRELVTASKGRLYTAQVLVRERLISTRDLLRLHDRVHARVYECPHCKQRHPRKDLPKKRGERFECGRCGRAVVLDKAHAALSRIEVLASRDPRELTVPLKPSEVAETASDMSTMDLERYEVSDELGRGGYGVVFKAFHRDLQREVALKVLRSGTALPEVALERFLREGRAVSRLKHPNVVAVYDIGRYRELFVMAMEYVPGKPLKEVLAERKRFEWREAAALMDEVLAGVQHAHEQGIIHRDLKPTNILIEEGSGRPRLIDFGLAKDLQSDAMLTQAGMIVGTPYYLSPEQIEGRSAEVDARSDVFSLGVLFYELLAGARPFTSRLKNEVYALILNTQPEPLRALVPDLPEELEEVVATAMAKKAADRWASAAEFRAALGPFLAADAGSGSDSSRTRARSGGQRRTGTASTARPRARKTTRGMRPVAARAPTSSPPGGNGLKLAVIGGCALLMLLVGVLVGRGGSASPAEGAGLARAPVHEPAQEPAGRLVSASLGADARAQDAPPSAGRPSPEPASDPAWDPTSDRTPPDPAAGAGSPARPAIEAPRAPGPNAAEDEPAAPVRPAPVEEPASFGSSAPPGQVPDEAPAAPPGEPGFGGPGEQEPAPPAPEPAGGEGVPAANGADRGAGEPADAAPAADVRLDDGAQDAREFPLLAQRSQKDWLERAFFLNMLADGRPTARSVRALRLGLLDRFPLNRAFALRGLASNPEPLLLSAGSQALFDNLRELVEDPEPYVARTSQALLLRLAGGGSPRSKSGWKAWWEEAGREVFLEAARHPPAPVLAAEEERVQTEGQHTRTREVTEYLSALRDHGLDIVFMLDVTASMSDELDRVRAQVTEITSFMDLLLERKVRMGFLTYGDDVVVRFPLDPRLDRFARAVEQIEIFNDPNDRTIEEGVSKALEDALAADNRLGWRKKAVRTILLLGDAPPLDPQRARELATQAGEHGFVLNALIAAPPPKYTHKDPATSFKELAKLGRGLTVSLTTPEELITRILVFAFGSRQEPDLRRFVHAYREVTGAANQPDGQ